MGSQTYIVKELTSEIRFIDFAIGLFPQLKTKNSVKKAIKKERFLLNNELATSGRWVKLGDEIKLVDGIQNVPQAYDLVIDIVFEDNYLVIVNKPAGIVVSGNQFKTLENALIDDAKLSTDDDAYKWVKPVHRLDAQTSGLVVFAKTASVHILLAKLFEERKINKVYHAIVTGKIEEDKQILLPVQGLTAKSELKVIKSIPSLQNEFLTWVELYPKTGRTHQLRIHCAGIGHPIVGDIIYGEKNNTLLHKGMFLAAVELNFIHPKTKNEVKIEIPVPNKFELFFNRESKRWKKFKE